MKSEVYEQALRRQGVSFSYLEKVPLAEINVQAGLRNQARLENPIEKELVDTYEQHYRDGVQFPPLVLWRPAPRSKYIPIDGNNRTHAATKAGKKFHDAYIVDTTDQQIIDRLTWTFNNLVNGKRLSREESAQHAVTFVLKYGMSVEKAAQEWNVPYWLVQRTSQAQRLRKTLANGQAGEAAGKISDETLQTLSPLNQISEDLFIAAARAGASSGATDAYYRELIRQVKGEKNMQAKAERVKEWSDSDQLKMRRAETKGGTVRRKNPAPRDLTMRFLREYVRLRSNFPDKLARRPPGHLMKEARGMAHEVANDLIELFGLGAKLPEIER